MANAISILGSASDVGKSLVTAGLCRLLTEHGLDVAPFKAQNMANQAGVTPEGLEMPRAQILQAAACRKAPHVDMGPVLMKPMSQTGAQIIVLGKSIGHKTAKEYFKDTSELAAVAESALDRLMAKHDVIVMEGAGSPVEINLWKREYVNLRPARRVGAPLILVVDIDKGGVFAQAKGTLDLLPEEDRKRVLGLVVNKFRGDISLFEDGIQMLEAIAGCPVLGVLPYLNHNLDEEDRPCQIPMNEAPKEGKLHVGAILYPRASNTEDLTPLLAESDCQITWITDPKLLKEQDLIILPGSKSTLGDLAYLAATGMTEAIRDAHAQGAWVLGICGGYQMLGKKLRDEAGTEGGPSAWDGLHLLETETRFLAEKQTCESHFQSAWPEAGFEMSGYEIHHGQTALLDGATGEALIQDAGAETGWRHGRAAGSYLHGLLANDGWRSAYLNQIRASRQMPALDIQAFDTLELRIQRWAEHLKTHLRPGAWEKILEAVE